MSKVRLGVLISGRGSNMKAIVEACKNKSIPAEVKIVISNKKNALGLELAKSYGIETKYINSKDYPSKEAYEAAITSILEVHNVELTCLAGYMKVLGPKFIQKHQGKLINIHPSLLPAFKGLDAQKQAFEYGVKIAGCSVHFVDETVDGGTIIMQDIVHVTDTDTLDSMTNNILKKEHILYPKAINWVIENHIKRGTK